MSVHDGHRERLREQYVKHGLESFNDLNTLELLLFYAIPRRDTNELAHALLEHFGSLEGVFDASVQQLEDVPGIGKNAAVLITLVPKIARRYEIDKTRDLTVIQNAKMAARYFIPRLGTEKVEKAIMICLDAQKRVIADIELNSGVVDAVELNVRKVVETAIKYRASSVILAHNHPSGNPIPSREDTYLTKRTLSALDLLGISLDDHIIVAGKEFASMADMGILNRLPL